MPNLWDEPPERTLGKAVDMRVGIIIFLAPIPLGLLLLGLFILPDGMAGLMGLLVLPAMGLVVAGAALIPKDWLGAGLGLSFVLLVLFLALGGWKPFVLLLWMLAFVFL